MPKTEANVHTTDYTLHETNEISLKPFFCYVLNDCFNSLLSVSLINISMPHNKTTYVRI